ncbi:MAG: hypothetical protein DRP18_05370 [Candidatus Aenigmatarchaeota archaeon]|nr:MAG: hypothetical protein DRP18_05370 [Candidatus Aenigmarchaeota archaeon]
MDKQEWKKIDALELLERVQKLYRDIMDVCTSSDLPPILVIGVLDSVKTRVHIMVNTAALVEGSYRGNSDIYV